MANVIALRPAQVTAEKTAREGTLMFRRSDVLGAITKLIHYARRNIAVAEEEGRTQDAAVQEARLRTLFAVRDAMMCKPVFANPLETTAEPFASGIETEGQDAAERLGAEHESPVGDSRDAQ